MASSKSLIFRSFINSFHYLYQDAETFHGWATTKQNFDAVRLCRTSVLLYITSMEALINRSLYTFLTDPQREFVMDREQRFSIEDKWLLLPILTTSNTFKKNTYPWQHFKELIKLRNDFVHPKHDRPGYYRVISKESWEPLPWKEIPEDMGIAVKEVVYPQTQIPIDPYAIKLAHVDKVKKIIDDTIDELDRLLNGKIKTNNWYRDDKMELFYPPGATMDDLKI